jgi:quercetin dioxygenase-like cupin family protein
MPKLDTTFSIAAKTRFSPERPITQLLHDSPNARLVAFGLEAGQEVHPHVSTSEVYMQIVEGQGDVLVGETRHPASAGDLFVCAPNVSHGFRAETRMIVLATITPRP